MSKEIISNIILIIACIIVFFILCHDHLRFYYMKIASIFDSTILIKQAKIVPLEIAEETNININTYVKTIPIKKVYIV